jgi:uncharacterized protein Usg
MNQRHSRVLDLQLQGYRLSTAEILYHMPDHPALLQTFLWEQIDLAPKFSKLHEFLEFWETSLDGRLHSVRVMNTRFAKRA